MSKVNRLIYFTKKHIGMDEDNRMYLEMINKYNSQKNIPRGYKVMKRDAWGCIFVSVMALYAGLEEDIPIECSCYHQLQLFKKKGTRIYSSKYYHPKIGDIVYFDWHSNGYEHEYPCQVGIITGINIINNQIEVVMGNTGTMIGMEHKSCVAKRTYEKDNRYIMCYVHPKYKEDAWK